MSRGAWGRLGCHCRERIGVLDNDLEGEMCLNYEDVSNVQHLKGGRRYASSGFEEIWSREPFPLSADGCLQPLYMYMSIPRFQEMKCRIKRGSATEYEEKAVKDAFISTSANQCIQYSTSDLTAGRRDGALPGAPD